MHLLHVGHYTPCVQYPAVGAVASLWRQPGSGISSTGDSATVLTGANRDRIRRAFQIAGVHTVVMSRWSVEDRATRQWMEALYQARLGDHLDTADAMRQASLTLIRERRARGQSTHPFYWAAFVAAGDWR